MPNKIIIATVGPESEPALSNIRASSFHVYNIPELKAAFEAGFVYKTHSVINSEYSQDQSRMSTIIFVLEK